MTQPAINLDTYNPSVFSKAPTPSRIVRAYGDVFRNVGKGALPLAYAFSDPFARRFGDFHVYAHWEGSDIWVTVLYRNASLYGAVLHPERGTCHVVSDFNQKIAARWPAAILRTAAEVKGRNLARAFALALAKARTDLESHNRAKA